MSSMVVTACFIGKIQKNIAVFASKIIDFSYFPHIFSHVPSIFPTFPHMFRPFSDRCPTIFLDIFPACSMKKIHPFVAALLAWLCPEKSNCCTRTSRAAYACCFVIIKWYILDLECAFWSQIQLLTGIVLLAVLPQKTCETRSLQHLAWTVSSSSLQHGDAVNSEASDSAASPDAGGSEALLEKTISRALH